MGFLVDFRPKTAHERAIRKRTLFLFSLVPRDKELCNKELFRTVCFCSNALAGSVCAVRCRAGEFRRSTSAVARRTLTRVRLLWIAAQCQSWVDTWVPTDAATYGLKTHRRTPFRYDDLALSGSLYMPHHSDPERERPRMINGPFWLKPAAQTEGALTCKRDQPACR